MKKGILERLAEGVVLGDGGYVLELEKRGYVIAGPFTPEVVLDHPEAVKQMHREFIRSGSEVIQAFAFYASREKLANVGYGEKVLDLNRQAVKIAREVAGDDVLVAGNLSTTWSFKQGDADSREIARRQFEEQLRVQVDEGVDFIIGELFFDLEEALIALDVAKATGLPVMMTMAYFKDKYSREGKDPAECAIALSQNGCDIVGINCGRGPNQMLPSGQGDAGSHRRLCRNPGHRLRDHRRGALLRRPPRLPRRHGALPGRPLRHGRLRPARQGHGHQLHRWVLRLGGRAHQGDGSGAWASLSKRERSGPPTTPAPCPPRRSGGITGWSRGIGSKAQPAPASRTRPDPPSHGALRRRLPAGTSGSLCPGSRHWRTRLATFKKSARFPVEAPISVTCSVNNAAYPQ